MNILFYILFFLGVGELLDCIGRLQHQLRSKNRDGPEVNLSSLQTLVKSPDFQRVLAVHNKVQSIWCLGCPPTPITEDVQGLVQEVSILRLNSSLKQMCFSPMYS
jgi:hypothetical protein